MCNLESISLGYNKCQHEIPGLKYQSPQSIVLCWH